MPSDRTTKIEQEVLKESKPKFSYLIRLWKYVFQSAKCMCMIFLGLSVLLSLLRPVLAFTWGKYVDSASAYTPSQSILSLVLLALAYYIIDFFSKLINKYTIRQEEIERLDVVQANRFQETLDTKMYRKIASLSPEHMEIPKINDTMSRVFGFTSDAWSGLNGSVMLPGYSIIAKTVSVLSIGASLYILNPWLCLILLVAPIPTLYVAYVGNKSEFKFIKDNAKLSRESDYYQGLMLGSAVKEIKVLGLFDFFYDKWKTRIDEYTIKERKVHFRRAVLSTINNSIIGLTSASANVFAIVLLTMGKLSIGALGAVMSLIGSLIADASQLFSQAATFLSKKNEAAMFFDLMDLPGQLQSGQVLAPFEELKAVNLKYRYPLTDRYVLDGINLTIHRNEKIAFVGENGAGKTTFVKIICGIVNPSDGELLINGCPAESWNPDSRYDSLSTVSQDPVKYTTFTIADNVLIGDSKRVRDEAGIDSALAFANLPVESKEDLLGKDIGGTDLSGGQWQKLAIARGYYRNRDFIILDEPTSNLDPLAETEVFRRYMAMANDKTVIMVTHRISLAALADRIIVFSRGKIDEDGTHETLMQNNGQYQKLYETQAKWYDR